MGALEAQVSVEGLEASDVAKAYLIEEGLISE
jgi:glycine betaine/choline ABC-type transport system substrate-binding protein